jgi:glycerol kinase
LMEQYILAIDQGTTGSRAVVYTAGARVVASSYREFKQYFPQPGWVEHNPEEIWHSVDAAIQDVLEQVPPAFISCVGITNQRETTVVWDGDTGVPVHNAIVWQCRRTAERCAQLNEDASLARLIREKTGLPLDAYFSATKIEWILKNVPGAADKARQGKLRFGTIDTWILHKLTSGSCHVTDYSNASRTMLFNIGNRSWDPDILKIFSIPATMLPEVKPSSGAFGVTAPVGKLPAGIPISGIAGDQQAALFGQCCLDAGEVKNTYGTGSFLLLNTGCARVSSGHGLITTLAVGPKGEPVYALEGSVFIAGAAIQWLRDGLHIMDAASDSEAMASRVKDNAGVYFVPALVGLGAPYWDPHARGSINGITRGTTREHIARAALEAMCYQTRDVLDAMKKDSGLEIRRLKVDGGAVANNFLCQFQADILGIEVVRPKIIETTSLGAALLAGLNCGSWKDADDLRRCWEAERIFSPRMNRDEAERLYAGWLEAVGRTVKR